MFVSKYRARNSLGSLHIKTSIFNCVLSSRCSARSQCAMQCGEVPGGGDREAHIVLMVPLLHCVGCIAHPWAVRHQVHRVHLTVKCTNFDTFMLVLSHTSLDTTCERQCTVRRKMSVNQTSVHSYVSPCKPPAQVTLLHPAPQSQSPGQ